MGRSLFILSNITFKMAVWQPCWIFRFPDSSFSFALNIMSKLHWHITCGYGKKPIEFQQSHFENGRLVAILEFSVSGAWLEFALEFQFQISYILIFRYVTSKMSTWRPYWIFPDFNFSLGIEHLVQTSVANYLYVWKEACWFSSMSLSKWLPGGHIGCFSFRILTSIWLWISRPNFSSKFLVYMWWSLLISSNVTFKMAACV